MKALKTKGVIVLSITESRMWMRAGLPGAKGADLGRRWKMREDLRVLATNLALASPEKKGRVLLSTGQQVMCVEIVPNPGIKQPDPKPARRKP